MLDHLHIHRPQSVRQQIRDELRQIIVSGRLAPGSALPSTRELAGKWQTPPANVHAALSTLVKEGLLVREQGVGTVVNQRRDQLERVALYSMASFDACPEADFEHAVMSAVAAEYSRRGIEVETLIDPRRESDQAKPLPCLTEAAFHRRVQAVVAARVSPVNLHWLQKLPVVGAFVSTFALGNTITMDDSHFFRESLKTLSGQSVRRVGLINPWTPVPSQLAKDLPRQKNRVEEFHRQVREWGMETRPEWIKVAERRIPERRYEWFGHHAFKQLWREDERPDGLVVYTDHVARGVMHGILETGVRVPADLRLALHRNAELPYYCSVPATFVEISTRQVARHLIDLIDSQFRGETVQNQTIQFSVNAAWSEAVPEPA